jgi:FkbM family methyltransferase
MTFYKAALRTVLKPITRAPFPGRYRLVEVLRPLIVQDRPIIAKTSDDLVFELDLNDMIQRQIYFGLYDKADVSFLNRLVKPGDIVFDVGGNIGFYTLNLARKVGTAGKVHVFEPIPENIMAIERNVELNSLQSSVIINPIAVSSVERELQLYISSRSDNSGWASIVASKFRPDCLNVKAISLDAYVAQNDIEHVALIKMDIEGAELQALQGMSQLLGCEDAPMIYFEINPFLLEKQAINPIDVKQFLSSFGFTLYALQKKQMIRVSPAAPEYSLRNILATKRRLTGS